MIVGTAITKEEVEYVPKYAKTDITPFLISQYTLNLQSKSEGDAYAQANLMKSNYSLGATTLLCIYNATGSPVAYVTDQSWHGGIGTYFYDQTIQNGEWSVILHGGPRPGFQGSEGAVVYRSDAVGKDVFLGWMSPLTEDNHVYVEVQGEKHWPNVANWNLMQRLVEKASDKSASTQGPLRITANVGDAYSSIVTAVLSLTH
jgi:hypothetical protein